jgi:hypothetical protein
MQVERSRQNISTVFIEKVAMFGRQCVSNTAKTKNKKITLEL